MQKIELVIFDLDGTLVDAYQAVAQSINQALLKMDLPQQDGEKIKRSVGWGERHLAQQLVAPDQVDRLLETYRAHHAENLLKGTFFLPGAKDLLDRLQSDGYKLALATNRSARFTQVILEHLAINQHFQFVLCGDQIPHPKPAPDMLFQILEFFSLEAQSALYVGDMGIDAEAGQQAGVNTVIVLTGSSTQEEVLPLKPYRIIQQISELKDLLWV